MSCRILLACIVFATPIFTAQAQPTDSRVDPTPLQAADKSGYTFFDPTPVAALRTFSTDRPTKGYSPVTVDAGHVQYETDVVSYTHSNVGGVSTRLYTAFDPVLKLGLTNRADFEMQYTGYNWMEARHPKMGVPVPDARGSGDLFLRTKVNLVGNEGGFAVGIIPYVKVPTAARYLGDGHTEGGVIVPVSIPGPWGFTVEVMPEVDILTNAADGGHHFSYTQLISLSHAITPKLTAFGEFYSALGTDRRTPPVYTADLALAYLLTDTLQLDAGANIGLNRHAPNLQAYTGLSQRF